MSILLHAWSPSFCAFSSWRFGNAGLMRVLEALEATSAPPSPEEAAAAARAAAGARADGQRPLRLAVRVLLLYLQVSVGTCLSDVT